MKSGQGSNWDDIRAQVGTTRVSVCSHLYIPAACIRASTSGMIFCLLYMERSTVVWWLTYDRSFSATGIMQPKGRSSSCSM